MSANKKILQLVSGWAAVELIIQCVVYGLWQFVRVSANSLWRGCRRKPSKSYPVEVTVDTAIGSHCYIKIMGVKYHYVETGPKSGPMVLVLSDAPDRGNLWGASWSRAVRRLVESGHRVVTLDLRGTGGSEGGARGDLSPPAVVEELAALMRALGAAEQNPATVIGFGIGGMVAWYLVHCHDALVSKFVVVGAPHPNLYWQHPPAPFCGGALHFIQWPYFPERWLAEREIRDGEGGWASTRACDWAGALNYIRGAAWWRIRPGLVASPPALLVGGQGSAAELVASAQHCAAPTLRLVATPDAADPELPLIIMDFLVAKAKLPEVEGTGRGLVGRVLGAVAGRGRELTARLVLPPA